MSDIRDFQPHAVLQHRVLEAIVFQWDGTQEQALAVVDELMREMEMRDAAVTGATTQGAIHVELSRSTQSATMKDDRTLSLRIVRKSDGMVNNLRIHSGEWLVIWLHEQRLYGTEVFSAERGEILFRPVRPVVMLRPREET